MGDSVLAESFCHKDSCLYVPISCIYTIISQVCVYSYCYCTEYISESKKNKTIVHASIFEIISYSKNIYIYSKNKISLLPKVIHWSRLGHLFVNLCISYFCAWFLIFLTLSTLVTIAHIAAYPDEEKFKERFPHGFDTDLFS